MAKLKNIDDKRKIISLSREEAASIIMGLMSQMENVRMEAGQGNIPVSFSPKINFPDYREKDIFLIVDKK